MHLGDHFDQCLFLCLLKCIYTFLQLLISYVRTTQRFELLQRKALYKYLLLLSVLHIYFSTLEIKCIVIVFQELQNIDWTKHWDPKIYIDNTVGEPKITTSRTIALNEKGEAFVTERRRQKGTYMEQLELLDFPFDVQVEHLVCE